MYFVKTSTNDDILQTKYKHSDVKKEFIEYKFTINYSTKFNFPPPQTYIIQYIFNISVNCVNKIYCMVKYIDGFKNLLLFIVEQVGEYVYIFEANNMVIFHV